MDLLYEDDAVIVAIKPVGLLSEQTQSNNSFADLLATRNGGYIGVIHRLDRAVSGVMVYAKTPAAAAKLSADVQAHTVKKEYLAILHGRLEAPKGKLCDLLFHDRTRNKTFVVDRKRAGVKEALLEYRTLGTATHADFGELTLTHVLLHTGRTHQIRVQFSSRGHSLLGDGKYGAHDRCDIALCSHRITFPHPITRREMTFSYTPTGAAWDLFSSF